MGDVITATLVCVTYTGVVVVVVLQMESLVVGWMGEGSRLLGEQ